MKILRLPKTPPKKWAKSLRDDERMLTVREVADLDRCSEKTVRRAIKAGLLEALRIGPSGRAIRITHEAHFHYRMRLRCGA